MFTVPTSNPIRSSIEFRGSAQTQQNRTPADTARHLSADLHDQQAHSIDSVLPLNPEPVSKSCFNRGSSLFKCLSKLFINNRVTVTRFHSEKQFAREYHNYISSFGPAIRKNSMLHDAFHAYVCTPQFVEINMHLRSIALGMPSPLLIGHDIPKHISVMQKAFESLKPTKKAFVTLRSIPKNALVDMMIAAGESSIEVDLNDVSSLQGKKLKEFGFMSTATTLVNANTGKSGDVLLEIEVPKGAKAGAVNLGIDGCTEVLFQPGQTLQINNAYTKNNRLYVSCSLLVNPEGQN